MYTEQQKKFILDNHDKLTRQQMAKRLNVSIVSLTGWAIELTGKKSKGRQAKKEPTGRKEGYFYHEDLATI